MGKECSHKECKDRQLCSTRYERSEHDGHPPVSLILDCTTGHDCRYRTAGSNEHRDERFSTEPELSENSVHDERNSCHVAYIFHEREKEEENHHLRNEGENRADTSDYSIDYEADQPGRCADTLQSNGQILTDKVSK